jgi:hypothetical protein
MALRYANSLLAHGGVVIASIPNIRYLPTIHDLIIHARWEYVESGILDKTHLRFFTQSSIVNIFEREGFVIDSICGIHACARKGPSILRKLMWQAYSLANILFPGKFDDMTFQQFAVVARPKDQLAERDNGKHASF